MLQRQLRDSPIPLCAHRDGLPEWCEMTVQRALAKVPGERFQSAEEFREALARATGPLPTADLARTLSSGSREAFVPPAVISDTIDLSQQRPAISPPPAGVERAASSPRSRLGWAHAAVAVVAIGAIVAAYVMLQGDAAQAAIESASAAIESQPQVAEASEPLAPVTAPVETVIADAPPREQSRPPAVAPPPAVETASSIATAPPVAPRRAGNHPTVINPPAPPPVEAPAPVEVPEPIERRVSRPAVEADPILVFETRALVGTRKSKEQGAQLVMGEGRITLIPTNNPSSPLCSFPYGRVLAINVSRGRDPLWSSPQGPAPVARAGGTLSKIGIQVTRDWIALRTSTEEQFVSMRFDEVLLKRVLLALEERTGHAPHFIELPKEKD
jgi:hypothetical protein